MIPLRQLREAGERVRKSAPQSGQVGVPLDDLDALLDIAEEAKHHSCALVGGSQAHLESSNEGTSYCRMCAALARLGEDRTP
jgi:hypothetical protein